LYYLIGLLLGDQAFSLCSFLTSVELMNGLLKLGGQMFLESGLKSVIIPSTITSYGLIVVVLFNVLKRRVINKHSLLINN
jgi:hypothetical protein